jgi:SAM-dependent methyltransferase
MDFAKPEHGFTPHGQFEGRSLEELVQDPEGRAALAAHIPDQAGGRQKLALAWLSWALQREVTLENLDQIAIEPQRRYLPALRFPALTRIYDPVVGLTSRERRFKEMLVEQAAPQAGQRILDLGCGTGTLAIQVKQRQPGADVIGLDADPEMLGRAREKAQSAGVELELTEGFADALPFEDASFDRVLSTLFFHHLDPEPKRRTAREIARVLRKGGELHVADWGRPSDPAMAVAFLGIRLLDGFANTADNYRGDLPAIFEEAGLVAAEETDRLRTVLGTLALYRAKRAS